MNHTRSTFVRNGVVAMAAVAALSLAACSSPDAPAADGKPIELTVLHAPINYEAVYLAEEQGFFKDASLDVTIVPGGTAQDNLGQLAGGSADISIVSWDAAVTATAEDLPIKLISGNGIISTEVDTSGVFVRGDSGITSIADLKGKTIAFNSVGSGGNVPVLQAMAEAGLDPKEVTQVALPFASMQTALENSQVDAIFPSDSFYSQVKAVDTFAEISNPSREFRGGLGITLWAVTEPWLAQNAETAKKFNGAMEKAVEFYSDPANIDAVYEVRSEVSGQPIDDVKGALVEYSLAIDPKVSQDTTDALAEFGFVTDPKSVDDILWTEAPRK
ncbi:ABC transporter substrate-binding protein [Mycetocola zhadangensis]|uniref:ABC transporter substrate-binding protein n=1 Tax=Mycetocola zhadangensis TaxID=1164595 RepID=A0A3L7IWI7_9MICO|nr:ABC transporter substrate-binding protein [Mycetocola zhadangensis]RLQ82588.1 ABC transporter substrate-binding protein [Mycetocola zhadangensis]GGF00043.1 nitrate ABC transporter substrate-binding protein [Mycetocola zhadangensis]